VERRRGRGGGTFVVDQLGDALPREGLLSGIARDRRLIEETLDFRLEVEPAAAALAAAAAGQDELAQIEDAARRTDTSASDAEHMRHDTEFHLAVAAATRNRFMKAAIEEVRLGLNDALSLLPESDAWHRSLSREHEAIAAAIESRDADAAAAAMDLHVANSVQGVRAALAAIKRSMAS
jgi:DNA-binding FadR family transcriptional regulator